MTLRAGVPEMFTHLLSKIEAHAALTQAVGAIASTLIAIVALYFAVRSLVALQRQTEATTATLTETFRPMVEVQGGILRKGAFPSKIDFDNKGHGIALNFRWRVDELPESWGGYTTNIIAPGEKGQITAVVDWEKGLILSYNSVAHSEEILTYVKFHPGGSVSNQHAISRGAAVTRLGWTMANPELAVPGWKPKMIAALPWRRRVVHWWRWKRGKERRL